MRDGLAGVGIAAAAVLVPFLAAGCFDAPEPCNRYHTGGLQSSTALDGSWIFCSHTDSGKMYFARMRADNYTWPQFWLHADGAGVRVGLNHDPGGAEGRDLPANTAWSLGRFSTAKIATSDLIWLCSSSASSPEIYYAFPGGKPDSPTNLGTIPAC